MKVLKRRLGFNNCFVVNSVSKSSGLALLWRDEVHLEMFNYSLCHINGWVSNLHTSSKWPLASFIGTQRLEKGNNHGLA